MASNPSPIIQLQDNLIESPIKNYHYQTFYGAAGFAGDWEMAEPNPLGILKVEIGKPTTTAAGIQYPTTLFLKNMPASQTVQLPRAGNTIPEAPGKGESQKHYKNYLLAIDANRLQGAIEIGGEKFDFMLVVFRSACDDRDHCAFIYDPTMKNPTHKKGDREDIAMTTPGGMVFGKRT